MLNAPESGTMRIAVPCFGEEVAPLFGAARRFRVWDVCDGEIVGYHELGMEEGDGIQRTRMMRRLQVALVIANGIESRLRQFLETEGIQVVEKVIGTASDALFGYLAGRLNLPVSGRPETGVTVHTADVVEWTRELFHHHGWEVRTMHTPEFFPVDMICVITCPVCRNPVRVAVCCGAHAYRVEEEIREFHRMTVGGYNARVFVHQAHPTVADVCRSYGVELLDPSAFVDRCAANGSSSDLPPLRGPVAEHNKLNRSSVA